MDKSIQNAFLKGVQLVYRKMFLDDIKFRLLDESSTIKDSVYDEPVTSKVYQPPIILVGHIVTKRDIVKDPDKGIRETTVFKIPTQEFIDHKIPYSPADYATLQKAVIIREGEAFRVDLVEPESNLAGEYILFKFECTLDDTYVKDSYDV